MTNKHLGFTAAQTPSERLNAILNLRHSDTEQRFDTLFCQTCVLVSCDDAAPANHRAKATFQFPVLEFYCNTSGNLHGGAQATIYDMLTGITLAAFAGDEDVWLNAGVSRALDVQFLTAAPEGEDVIVDCEVVSKGARLAFLKAEMRLKESGKVVSSCTHDKASVANKKRVGDAKM